jgi:glycogen synthase
VLSQVGGLGDVVTSLSRAIQDLGHKVEVIIPKYDCLDLSNVSCKLHFILVSSFLLSFICHIWLCYSETPNGDKLHGAPYFSKF